MPTALPKVCSKPGCGGLVHAATCSRCGPLKQRRTGQQKRYDGNRGADRQFYSTTRWRRFRKWYAGRHPKICSEHKRHGRLVAGDQLDHIIARKNAPELAYDENNVEWLCPACHNQKRARE